MRLWIDPALAEEAVFERMRVLAAAESPEAGAWNRAREALYREPPATRARAFTALAESWFERLACLAPLRAALAHAPHVARHLDELHLRRALRRAQEGSELFRDGVHARLVFGLTPTRFADPDELGRFFLRESLYAEDMLDPAVGYAPESGGGLAGDLARADLVRDRLRVLWAARVQGKLARLGLDEPERKPLAAFVRAFGEALEAEELENLHARATGGELGTFPQWLAAAQV